MDLSRGIVQIHSTYLDEATNRPITVHGTGVIIRSNFCVDQKAHRKGKPPKDHVCRTLPRYYALTASHVSQGGASAEPTVLVDGKPARILGRLADNDNDVEVIELGDLPEDSPYFAYYIGASFRLPDRTESQYPSRITTLSDSYHIYYGNWIRLRDVPSPSSKNWDVDYTAARNERSHSFLRVKAGMSGSPLVEKYTGKDGKEISILGGLVSRTLRSFRGTFFSTPFSLRQLFDRYYDGGRGRTAMTIWRMRHGLTFQQIGKNTLEIQPLSTSTGNGTSGDAGNGTSGDAGDSSRGQFDLRGQGWKEFDIGPGMIFNGKPAIAFRVDIDRNRCTSKLREFSYLPKESLRSLYLSGSLQNLRFIRSSWELFEYLEPVTLGASLLPALKLKARTRQDRFRLTEIGGTLQVGDGRIDVEFKALKETLRFSLAYDGSRLGPDGSRLHGYQPVIQVTAVETGRKFWVDLRGIFFIDPTLERDSSSLMNQLSPKLDHKAYDPAYYDWLYRPVYGDFYFSSEAGKLKIQTLAHLIISKIDIYFIPVKDADSYEGPELFQFNPLAPEYK